MSKSKRIVITVFGSLGDLHPLIALGLGLQARGHQVVLAASRMYQSKIEAEGLVFSSLGPEQVSYEPSVLQELFDPIRGPERLIKKYVLPYVRGTYDELAAVVADADLLINSPMVYAGPVVAEVFNKPWVAIQLQPFTYFSALDPPLLPQLRFMEALYSWGHWFWRLFFHLAHSTTTNWPQSVYQLRRDLGLPKGKNPIFDGQFSPYLNLALFSSVLAKPQADWPLGIRQTGFLFYDRMQIDESALPPEIQAFLAAGEPPVVFTLGSSAVHVGESFYATSVQAAKTLGCRAIFVAGENPPPDDLGPDMLWWSTMAYSALFPYAAVVVHQGGVGTCAQALRAGKPMLIVPHGFDQPDNAVRLKRNGIARTLYPEAYTVSSVVGELSILLHDSRYAEQAMQAKLAIQREDALRASCEAIEELF